MTFNFSVTTCPNCGKTYATIQGACTFCGQAPAIVELEAVVVTKQSSKVDTPTIVSTHKQKGNKKAPKPKEGLVKPLKFFVPINPEPKERPRFGGGNVYTPSKTSDYEKAIKKAAKDAIDATGYIMPSKDTPLLAIVQLFRADRRGADGDNMLKAVLDALNGVAYADDKQILMKVVTIERGVGLDRAGVAIEIRYYFQELGILDNLQAANG